LAIFLDSLQTLKNITNLTNQQIEFIKDYKRPFTILVNTNEVKDKKIISSIEKLPNKQEYTKIAFRISHCKTHKNLIKENTYFFLTSANRSGEPEIKSSNEIKKQFEKEIKKYNIKLLAEDNYVIDSKQNASDIFEFVNSKIIYYRK
jgi:tRNA A37 threonylcarbamoyladenosine synthetase subunit TsaC/SUA5/YrdC